MKPGYSLIELTIGILLASLLAISLFQSVKNTTHTVELADDIMDLDVRVANFHHQFERDTIGIFMPIFAAEALQDSEKKETAPGLDKQAPGAPKLDQKALEESKPQKVPDRLFYSVNGDAGQVTEFTFITSNPLRVYEKAANVTVKPRMVRVMYRLVADPKDETVFTLLRQESEELDIQVVDPKSDKPVRGYTLLSNIKKMSLEFSYPVKKEPEKQSAPLPGIKPEQSAKQAAKRSSELEIEKIETRADWPFKTVEEAKQKQVPEMPQFITAKFELWDDGQKSFREFTLTYPIASFTLLEKKQKKKPVVKQLPKAPSTQAQTTKRVESIMKIGPKTEERLKQLGQKVFEVTLPDTDLSALKNSNLFISKKERAKKVKGVS